MRFRHISAKIQPKNLVHYWFLAVRVNIWIWRLRSPGLRLCFKVKGFLFYLDLLKCGMNCLHEFTFQYTFFYKNNLIRTRGYFCSKFRNKLKTIPATAKEQILKVSI